MKYYLIYGVDPQRKQRMLDEFANANIDNSDVTWISHPNKDELTEDLLSKYVDYSVYPIKPGQISCTYKHYLCLKDIVENNHEYAVIIEDNVHFLGNVPEKVQLYIDQLNELYPEWDICFDLKYHNFKPEQSIIDGIYVYPKTNEITEQCHGGTKCAAFYIITQKCAKKLLQNYVPFQYAPDFWMNKLFREHNIKSFWTYPENVEFWPHVSTAIN